MTSVLLLAGTAEARALAGNLCAIAGLNVIASLAGVTQDPAPYPVPVRTGGFGGSDGLADWLRTHRPDVLIDATHPYAARMQANAVTACETAEVPRLRLLRPAWPARRGWVHAPDLEAAAKALPANARVLVTTGRKDIAPFATREDTRFILRTIEPVPDLPQHMDLLIARPPFTRDQEQDTMARHKITHLVTKNAGGTGTAKLDAADSLRLTTIMVDRPPKPIGAIAATVPEAVAWLRRTVAI